MSLSQGAAHAVSGQASIEARTEPKRAPEGREPLLEVAEKHLLQNYRQAPFVLERGAGCEVWDTEGRRYLDLCAGVAVASLGHAHPQLVATIAAQAGKLIHTSNYFFNAENLRLAGEICDKTGFDRVMFCNSGTEAIEALLKLGRRHFWARGEVSRFRVIAFHNSFHGRSLGALAATGNPKYHEGFGPLGGVTHVAFGDAAAVRAAMGPDVAAILVEPVQGEGGVVPAPAGFLAELRAIADEHGALLLVDEIQTGIGRTGTMLGCEHFGVRADAIALAKGLGGGFPIGAMLCRESLGGALPPGSHGTTFGGNPLASAVARTVLRVIDEERILEAVARKGEHLSRRLADLAAKHPSVCVGERGLGLLRGLRLAKGVDTRAMLEKVRDRGVLLTVAGADVLRFSPPLIVTEAQLDEGVAVVDEVLAAAVKG